VILQFGALFGGLASTLGEVARQALPGLLDIGGQFLQRELTRKDRRRASNRAKANAISALNTPGISVARVGGTLQPVGGRVQRSTFFPSAQTPAQSPLGNIPLLPVGLSPRRGPVFNDIRQNPVVRAFLGAPAPQRGTAMANGQGPLNLQFRVPLEGPRFAQDEMGKTIMFVPSPDGSGFISVQQARGLNLTAMKPWWRFNRATSRFEKVKSRRMNPFNFKAASRAGRRIERTLDAIKDVVSIQRKMDKGVSAGGKVIKFRTKKRKKA